MTEMRKLLCAGVVGLAVVATGARADMYTGESLSAVEFGNVLSGDHDLADVPEGRHRKGHFFTLFLGDRDVTPSDVAVASEQRIEQFVA